MAENDVDRIAAELVRAGIQEDRAHWLASGAPADLSGLFRDNESIESLDLSGWDVSCVRDMSGMFYGCSSLRAVDVSGWDTSRVGSMSGMFYQCSSLESLDLSGWDVSCVEDMVRMFYQCSSLRSVGVSGWDTSVCVDFSRMFDGCGSLASLDLSGWDLSSASDEGMLAGCSSLRELRTPREGSLGVFSCAAGSLPAGARIVVSRDNLDWYRDYLGSRGFEVVTCGGRSEA